MAVVEVEVRVGVEIGDEDGVSVGVGVKAVLGTPSCLLAQAGPYRVVYHHYPHPTRMVFEDEDAVVVVVVVVIVVVKEVVHQQALLEMGVQAAQR